MIESFKNKETEKIFNRRFSKKLPQNIQRVAQRKLEYLHAVKNLDDLSIPVANRLESLQGDREGQHSIRINNQWRICFKWNEGHIQDVEIIDYH